MFQISTGEKMIDISDRIAEATKLYISEKSYFNGMEDNAPFMTFDEGQVAHAIGDAILDFLESLDAETLLAGRGDMSWNMSKKLAKVEPFEAAQLIEVDFSEKLAA